MNDRTPYPVIFPLLSLAFLFFFFNFRSHVSVSLIMHDNTSVVLSLFT